MYKYQEEYEVKFNKDKGYLGVFKTDFKMWLVKTGKNWIHDSGNSLWSKASGYREPEVATMK